MQSGPLDLFTQVVFWKAVPLIILAGIGFLVLRELLRWLDRRSIRELRPLLSYKGSSADRDSATLDGLDNGVLRCPLCNGLMVKRTVRDGANAGSAFWGCFGFPRCRGTRAA